MGEGRGSAWPWEVCCCVCDGEGEWGRGVGRRRRGACDGGGLARRVGQRTGLGPRRQQRRAEEGAWRCLRGLPG
jgi:hypothetical protein